MALDNRTDSSFLFKSVSISATGTLVSAVTDRRIRVLGYVLVLNAGLTINFESGTTDISGAMVIAANGGVSYAGGLDAPAFQTAKGEALGLTISGSGDVRGHLTYILVED